jgi:2-keto-4-pentenoate hydratase|tara:strand:- start:1291 stop:2211 length:921 start_codon:yes stop_codon:yes gene_type:complete
MSSSAATAFDSARNGGTFLDAAAVASIPVASWEEVLKVHDALVSEGGRSQCGWKVGMNSTAAWGAHKAYGLTGPITGPLFGEFCVPSGGVVGPSKGLIMAEAEWGFRFAKSPVATGPDGTYVAKDITSALSELVLCIEMCGTRFANNGKPTTICQKLADHALNTAVVTGKSFTIGEGKGCVSIATLTGLGAREVNLVCGTATAVGTLDAIPQLVYLANHLAGRGKAIAPADLVITGATAVLKGGATFVAGSKVIATFPHPLGGDKTIDVTCTTREAQGVSAASQGATPFVVAAVALAVGIASYSRL